MILSIQIILISVLILTLTTLYLEEKAKRHRRTPTARLTRAWEGSERRVYIRVDADIPVKYAFPKEAPDSKAGRTKNISVGGICLSLTEKLNLHDRLSLEISIPGISPLLVAKGEVAWVKEDTKIKNSDGIRYFDAGIEFKDLAPKDRERLFGFIKQHENIRCE